MLRITPKEWFDMKKQRGTEVEQWATNRVVKTCECGEIYSYDPSYEKDFGMCVSCRGDEEPEIKNAPIPGQKRTD